ncbi:hypothetical protein GOP47_0006898, partial [Adiantum capillus-veneris]
MTLCRRSPSPIVELSAVRLPYLSWGASPHSLQRECDNRDRHSLAIIKFPTMDRKHGMCMAFSGEEVGAICSNITEREREREREGERVCCDGMLVCCLRSAHNS